MNIRAGLWKIQYLPKGLSSTYVLEFLYNLSEVVKHCEPLGEKVPDSIPDRIKLKTKFSKLPNQNNEKWNGKELFLALFS